MKEVYPHIWVIEDEEEYAFREALLEAEIKWRCDTEAWTVKNQSASVQSNDVRVKN